MSLIRPRSQRGVSLIEILVAVFTLSVGLLGIAAMQTKSLQFNQSAYMRTQATVFANDIIDRMRVNQPNAAAYALSIDASPATPPVNCAIADCTPAQLASYDLRQWHDTIVGLLPNGDGAVEDLGGGVFRIRIRWTDRDDVSRDFDMETRI